MKKTIRTATTGRLRICRRFRRFYRVSFSSDPILIKKKGKYWIRIGSRSFRVFFDDEKIIDEALRGLWSVDGVDVVKCRRKVLIRVHLKREVEVEDKPKTVIKLSKRGKTIVAVVFRGKKVVDEVSFKLSKKVAEEIVNYVRNFKKPIIVSRDEIPGLKVKAALNGIDVVESFVVESEKIRVKPLLVGLLVLLAIAATAMVYYSSFSVATITVEKKLDVSVNIDKSVVVYAPGMGTKKIGYITANVYNGSANYRLIIQLASLKTHCGCEVIAVQIYDGNILKGIITPLTPSLIIEDSETKTYTVKIFYLALKPCQIKIALQASIELIGS